jgi:hypothetical protein
MRLPEGWSSGLLRRKRPLAPDRNVRLETVPASGLDDLQMRLNQWGHLWSAENESATGSAAQQLIAERLTHWIQRCFGKHVPGSLQGNGDRISLATSTPILTAFLGRRATRELSRRVLRDI